MARAFVGLFLVVALTGCGVVTALTTTTTASTSALPPTAAPTVPTAAVAQVTRTTVTAPVTVGTTALAVEVSGNLDGKSLQFSPVPSPSPVSSQEAGLSRTDAQILEAVVDLVDTYILLQGYESALVPTGLTPLDRQNNIHWLQGQADSAKNAAGNLIVNTAPQGSPPVYGCWQSWGTLMSVIDIDIASVLQPITFSGTNVSILSSSGNTNAYEYVKRRLNNGSKIANMLKQAEKTTSDNGLLVYPMPTQDIEEVANSYHYDVPMTCR